MSNAWERVRRWGWRGVKIAAVLAILAGAAYAWWWAPVAVTPHRVEQGVLVAEVMGTGTLEAPVKTTISSKISGRIAEVKVDQGDRVKAGALLVRLDDEELQQQVAIAEANREATEAAIERLKTDKDRATVVFERAERSHARLQTLSAERAVSREDLDRAAEAMAVAQAELSRAEAAIAEGRKEVVAAEKTLEYHRARLADTRVEAHFDGLIVQRQREPGDVVVPGSAILTLISDDELWISAWVDETEMAKLEVGQNARVIFRSEPADVYSGRVDRLGRETDRETREFIVDVGVLNLPRNWAIGQRAEVYIETARKDSATLLPMHYVVWRDEQPGVFVARDDRASWRPLTLGRRGADVVEVTAGLEPEETVLIPADSQVRLRDGQRIRR